MGEKAPDLVNICWALTTSQAVSWAHILTHLILITALLGRYFILFFFFLYFIFDLADEEIEAQRIRPQFKSRLCRLLAVWSWANNLSIWMFIFGAINGDNTCWQLDFQIFSFLMRYAYHTLAFHRSVLKAPGKLLGISGQVNVSCGMVMFQPTSRPYSLSSIASVFVQLGILMQLSLIIYKTVWKVEIKAGD